MTLSPGFGPLQVFFQISGMVDVGKLIVVFIMVVVILRYYCIDIKEGPCIKVLYFVMTAST